MGFWDWFRGAPPPAPQVARLWLSQLRRVAAVQAKFARLAGQEVPADSAEEWAARNPVG